MSDQLRIALVAEGPTDRIVIEAALRAILAHRQFVLTQLQPEGSVAFSPLGGGWGGVYRWCKQAAARGDGRLTGDILFQNYDLLILHLDADVANKNYSDDEITPDSGDDALPCARPCPPASATTNALRVVALSWCGEAAPLPRTVFCTPSKSTEAWIVAALFPRETSLRGGLECLANPEARLAQQPKAKRIQKTQRDYQNRQAEIAKAWSRLAAENGLTEARRFQDEFVAAAATVDISGG